MKEFWRRTMLKVNVNVLYSCHQTVHLNVVKTINFYRLEMGRFLFRSWSLYQRKAFTKQHIFRESWLLKKQGYFTPPLLRWLLLKGSEGPDVATESTPSPQGAARGQEALLSCSLCLSKSSSHACCHTSMCTRSQQAAPCGCVNSPSCPAPPPWPGVLGTPGCGKWYGTVIMATVRSFSFISLLPPSPVSPTLPPTRCRKPR